MPSRIRKIEHPCIYPSPFLIELPASGKMRNIGVLDWYRCRWEIEIYFRVLKQGCRIERLRLETDKRLLNGIALYLVVAWRVHTITMQSREWPEVTCEVLFSTQEWKTIYLMQQKKKPPKKPPTLRTMTRMLAQLEGFLARKGDGKPGIKNIWRGYRGCLTITKVASPNLQVPRELLL